MDEEVEEPPHVLELLPDVDHGAVVLDGRPAEGPALLLVQSVGSLRKDPVN